MKEARVIALTGDLDLFSDGWQNALREAEGEAIFIDLSAVTLMTAAFAGELARLRKRLPGARIRTVGLGARHRRVFTLLRVEEMLRLPAG